MPPERVFAAWADPVRLAQWWGPKGFRNTFHEFDLRPGGQWRFIMHGPDGRDYPNQSVFREIVAPERIIFDHVSPPHFAVTATFTTEAGGTRLVFRMLFEDATTCAAVRPICVPSNEQNFDRLEAVLAGGAAVA